MRVLRDRLKDDEEAEFLCPDLESSFHGSCIELTLRAIGSSNLSGRSDKVYNCDTPGPCSSFSCLQSFKYLLSHYIYDATDTHGLLACYGIHISFIECTTHIPDHIVHVVIR